LSELELIDQGPDCHLFTFAIAVFLITPLPST